MTWFKLDDKSTFHAKVIAAGNHAWGALCRAGTWCSEHGTDGVFTSDIATVIEPSRKIWSKLEAVGLIDATANGWSIHDFTVYNPTAEQVREKREARAKAGSQGGKRSGETRANAKQEPSKNEAIASTFASTLLQQCSSDVEAKTNPDPDPDPVREERETSDKPPSPAPSGSGPSSAARVFDVWLSGWRSHVGRGAEPRLTDKRRGLVRARLKEHPIEIVEAAAAGVWRSAWHVENGHTDFDLAMRDAGHVERFSNEYEKANGSSSNGSWIDDPHAKALAERAMKAIRGQ